MKIIESYYDAPLKQDPKTLAERYNYMLYDIHNNLLRYVKNILLPGNTVVMFSGSWRLDLDATYIELKMFQNSLLNFHKSTIFMDHNNQKLFDYVLSKLKPTNLLILHNDWWIAHDPIQHVLTKLDKFLKCVECQHGQIICTLPLIHTNFNKLTTSLDDLKSLTNGTIVDDSLVIVRT